MGVGRLGTSTLIEDNDVVYYLVHEDYLDDFDQSCTPHSDDPYIPEGDLRFAVQHKLVTLAVGWPYVVAWDVTIPTDIPLGFYRICVEMDPFDELAETDETDNVVIMDARVEVFE